MKLKNLCLVRQGRGAATRRGSQMGRRFGERSTSIELTYRIAIATAEHLTSRAGSCLEVDSIGRGYQFPETPSPWLSPHAQQGSSATGQRWQPQQRTFAHVDGPYWTFNL